MNNNNLEKIFEFLGQAGKLRNIYRFGDVKGIIKDSVASHSWRLSLMVVLVARELELDINIGKAVELVIAHDLVESVSGDYDYVEIASGDKTKKQKYEAEQAGMAELQKKLPDDLGKRISGLWDEYASRNTREAKFVYALDKLEALKTLLEAGHKCYYKPEYIPNYADEAVADFPELKPILELIKHKLKQEFEKGGFGWKEGYD